MFHLGLLWDMDSICPMSSCQGLSGGFSVCRIGCFPQAILLTIPILGLQCNIVLLFLGRLFIFPFLNIFLMFIFEGETECAWGRGRERERGRHRIRSRFQALSCQHGAWHGGRTHKPWDHELRQSRMLNQLSYPGATIFPFGNTVWSPPMASRRVAPPSGMAQPPGEGNGKSPLWVASWKLSKVPLNSFGQRFLTQS